MDRKLLEDLRDFLREYIKYARNKPAREKAQALLKRVEEGISQI